MRHACLAGLVYLLGGCSSPLQEYQCTSSVECTGGTGGRCEPSGHCSFVDDTCEDGFRYGEVAGAESGECVTAAKVDAGADAPLAPPPDWLQRKRLTFNNVAHAEDLVEFPVLVVLTPERIDYARVQPEGQDIRFTDPSGQTLLAYEIESWDPQGTSLIWVKPQQIDASVDTDYIYLYYDNALAADAQDAHAVWSNGYEVVYHFADEGDVFVNSAGPNNQGNNVGTTPAAGVLGGGREFDGTNTYLSINDGAPANLLQGVAGYTATAWIRPQVVGTQQALVSVGTGDTPCTNKSRLASLISNTAGELSLLGRSLDSDPLDVRTTQGASLAVDTWTLTSMVVDVDFLHTDGANQVYGRISAVVNATPIAIAQNPRFAGPATDTTPSTCATLGTQEDASNDFFAGIMDEVRISGVDRSVVWLQAQYQSMSDADFVRVGAAEDVDEPVEF